jgi:membrane protein implicated in regulation of membrane protease activity
MSDRRDLRRYLLWQLPSWIVAALVLVWLIRAIDLSPWVAAVVFGLFICKDLALYPAMRGVFSPSPFRARPIGARGEAIEPLNPVGYVRVNGELWRGEACDPDRPIAAGSRVIVRDGHGLTLIVEHAESVSDGARSPGIGDDRSPRS